MTVLIIEDEDLAAERLEKLLRKLDPGITIAGTLDSVAVAQRWFARGVSVDLIFSDIQLSDGLSFQIFESFTAHSPIIFTTSYDEYAIRAFQVKSIDYLLKPIKLPDLAKALAKYETLKQAFSPQSYAKQVESLLDSLALNHRTYKTRFLVRQGEQLIPVLQDQIAYFFAANEFTCLVDHTGQQYMVDYNLEELSALVDPRQFFRLNRQFIVHMNAIKKIHPYFAGKLKIDLRPLTTQDVFVSREKASLFKAWLNE